MYTVYVLYSKSFDKIYVGFTSDINQRLKSHNESGTGWTSNFRPWELIHQEFFEKKSDAMNREKQLKTAKGREWIWQAVRSLHV